MTALPRREDILPYEHSLFMPRHSRRQHQALLSSIETNGQLVPTLLWKHEGKFYLLDGATSLKLCQIAQENQAEDDEDREGEEPSADTRPSLEPRFEIFQGTPEQAEALFIARNFQRRFPTPSQVAMYAALAGFIPEPGVGPQTGRYIKVREVAEQFAVSRSTLYAAGNVASADPELARQVLEGNYSVGYANQIIKGRTWTARTGEAADASANGRSGGALEGEEPDDEEGTFEDDELEEDESRHRQNGVGENGSAGPHISVHEPGEVDVRMLPLSPHGRNRARITAEGALDADGHEVIAKHTSFIQALVQCDTLERSFRGQLALLDQLELPSLTNALRDDMRRGIRRRLALLVSIRPSYVCTSCNGESAADALTDFPANRSRLLDPELEDEAETEDGACHACDGYGYLTATMRQEHCEIA